ncbi:aldo/keto reductase [Actinomadura graeca]|uniref:Aldo/keto reductase n=2 Tax=Actinomadura graeca TaxID=2750812 RepID=A0ABX8RC25_9ACTN|nr:aldo/keto reductase [Actinomadura graeca]QXJ26558.1 aldo/keto reductase [Actinomadura graeca]
MEHVHLGRSGMVVSRLCLGTLGFGPRTSEPDAHTMMDLAHEHGVNFFDTADSYGGDGARGRTEEIIGDWFMRGVGRRDRTVLATKVYGAMGGWPNEERLSALHIKRACDASLRRLRTDRIELYQLHHVDRRTPWEEIWEALSDLRAQGKILYVGTSNHAAWHLVKAQERASRLGLLGLVSEQPPYSLAQRTAELEVLPACQDYGIGVLPWSPLHRGLLSGVLRRADGVRSRGARARRALEGMRDRVEAYEAFCAELGEDPAAVALAWLLHQPAVTAPVIGPRTAEQLVSALHARDVRLDTAALARLDAIFPGPGGAAPEAYAW